MHTRLLVFIAVLGLFSATAFAQSSPVEKSTTSAAPTRTELYHVHFNHAAPGKASELANFLKTPDPSANGHAILLRHEDGAAWDYVAIEHLGTKATVEAVGNPRGPTMKGLSAKHEDTYVNGPSWSEFAKAMGLDDEGKSKSAESVYVVSIYRPIAGQEDALEKFLSEPPSASNDLAVGAILMQHVEGGAWRYLSILRYKSWPEFAKSEATSVAESAKGKGGWFKLRDYISFHEDTIAYRIAP